MMRIKFKVLPLVFLLAFLPGFTLDQTIPLTNVLPVDSTGNIYYVSPSGNDNNPGTLSNPWKTPSKAGSTAQAGDTVIFRGGVYGGQLAPKNSGNSTDGWITFKAYPGEEPVIIDDHYWSRAVYIGGVSFIEINGLTTEAAGPNGPAIYISNAHHVRIINCVTRDSPTAGIVVLDGIDYLTIEGNRIYGNSNTSPYNSSAIGIGQAAELTYDNAPGYHIIIRNNLIYDNRVLIANPTDGNGINLDNNDLGGTPDLQNHKTLVANNVFFHNGGRCIQVLNSSNADIVNNTCYHNLETQRIAENCNGEINLQRITAFSSAININVYNNVAYGKGGTCNNGSKEAYVFQVMCSQYGCPQFTSDYNLWYNGAVEQLGPHDIIADPIFKNPSLDPAAADFSLMDTSPAIDSGSNQFAEAVPRDYLGIARPQGEGFDRGAYEFIILKFIHLPLVLSR